VAGRCTIIIRSPLHSHGNDYTTTARGTGSLSENVSHAAADQKQRAAAAAAAAAAATAGAHTHTHTHRQQPYSLFSPPPFTEITTTTSRRHTAHRTYTYYTYI
jgi:hypothetical protein